MFKGLRSKLEDEAKRIQALGGNIANQVRSTAVFLILLIDFIKLFL
jgi:hypothetical protein